MLKRSLLNLSRSSLTFRMAKGWTHGHLCVFQSDVLVAGGGERGQNLIAGHNKLLGKPVPASDFRRDERGDGEAVLACAIKDVPWLL